MTIDDNAYQSFCTNGYFVHAKPAIPLDLVARASEGIDELRAGHYDTGHPPFDSPWKPGDDPDILCKIENPQFANSAILELIGHPALGEAAATIVGADWIQVWWVQLLYKPPATSKAKPAVGWHRDRVYWDDWTLDSELFTIWVGLSDVGPDSGPMLFVPGSHLWQTDAGGDFFNADPETQKESIPVPPGQTWKEVPALMEAGGFSVHHSQLYHGSGPNLSELPRRSLAIHARTDQSWPVSGDGSLLTQFIERHEVCPIIYGG